jgi:2-polyprenyl-3-methyl-5-hydroxy-6-metoxy-1,4-benzoquinol methylase
MKKFNIENCNTPEYWDKNQTCIGDFGLRQQKYLDLAGVGNTILEVGCGLSPFLEVARKNFSNTIGFDFSPETIKKAQELFPKVDYRLFDVTKLNEIENKFANVVVAGEVIEHLEDPDNFLKELERLAITKVIISIVFPFSL